MLKAIFENFPRLYTKGYGGDAEILRFDLDGDGYVASNDYTLFGACIGMTSHCLIADFNEDGVVDTDDYNLFGVYWWRRC